MTKLNEVYILSGEWKLRKVVIEEWLAGLGPLQVTQPITTFLSGNFINQRHKVPVFEDSVHECVLVKIYMIKLIGPNFCQLCICPFNLVDFCPKSDHVLKRTI